MSGVIGLTACQVRMARAALRWSVEELARHSGVSEKTIRRIEKVYGFPPNVTLDVLNKLRLCFEEQGMTLIPDDDSPEGPGVRFGSYPGRVVRPRVVQGGFAVEPPVVRSKSSG
jgi:DNA-binding XRE family transcriptional regulator